jgi:hypothetical protein
MSLDAVSGISGSSLASLDRSSTVTQAAPPAPGSGPTQALGATRASGAVQASGASGTPTQAPMQAQPLLLIPTEPLTPRVLAELIGLQVPLSGTAFGQ